MESTTEIRDIMTSDLIIARPDETIAAVRKKLIDNLIHHIPVVADGKVQGMISLNDIYRMEHHFTVFNNPEAEASNQQLFSSMLAKEIMTTPVVKIREDEPVSIAVDIFLQNMFHALPVVNYDDELVGMVTTFDLIRHSLEPKP